MVAVETGKWHIVSDKSNVSKEEKMFHQKLESDRFELPLKIVQGKKKWCNIKNVNFEKKGPKVEKHNIK